MADRWELFDVLDDIFFSFDLPTGKLLYCNKAARNKLNFQPGKDPSSVFELYPGKIHQELIKIVTQMEQSVPGHIVSALPLLGFRGEDLMMDTHFSTHYSETGPIAYALARDVTFSRTFSEILSELMERLSYGLEGSGFGYWDWNLATDSFFISQRCAEMMGYGLDELAPASRTSWESLIHLEDKGKVQEALSAHLSGKSEFYECEQRKKTKKEGWIWFLDRGKVVEKDSTGQALRMVGTQVNIQKKKTLEEELYYAATTDQLTSTLNRRAGLEFLQKGLKLAKRTQKPLALLYLDLDGLKKINDGLGHAVGDKLIHSAAMLLIRSLRETDALVRMGGDEFLAILPDCDKGYSLKVWERIQGSCTTPPQDKPYEPTPQFSHGWSYWEPGSQLDADSLIALADEKMYQDKKERKIQRG